MKLHADGLIDKWEVQYYPQRLQCKTMPRTRPTTLYDMQGIFYTIAVTLTLALTVFLLEIVLGCLSVERSKQKCYECHDVWKVITSCCTKKNE